MGVLAVLAVVDKVLSNRRVQGALTGKPQPTPATCGQDQRLDVLIEEVRLMREALEQLVELQAEALRFAAEQAGPVSVNIDMDENAARVAAKLSKRKG